MHLIIHSGFDIYMDIYTKYLITQILNATSVFETLIDRIGIKK